MIAGISISEIQIKWNNVFSLFWYQRTTDEMLHNVNEVNKERTCIAAASSICVTGPDRMVSKQNTVGTK